MKHKRTISAAAVAVWLAGCASTAPLGPAASGGATTASASRTAPGGAFKQTGVASWYGPGFHGRTTASGERYDMHAMTAAHPTLPLPSFVRVRNPANGREVVVKVNDRGPFHPGRIIDLSYAAARKLGVLIRPSKVEIEVVERLAGND